MKKKESTTSGKSTVSLDRNRLIRELENSEVGLVKKNAIRDLVKLHAVKAIPQIVNALRDEDWDVREEAGHALDRLGWEKDGGVREACYHLVKGNWSELVALGSLAFLPLSDALNCKERAIRMKAVESIVEIGGEPAVELLMSVLKDNDWQLRMQAARALGAFEWGKQGGEEEAVYQIAWGNWQRCAEIGAAALKPLTAALIQGDNNTRAMAARTIGQVGDRNCCTSLVKAFKDKDWNVRRYAAQAAEILGWQADSRENRIHFYIAKNDWDSCVKMGEAAVSPLIEILSQKQKMFHDEALKALVAVGRPAIEPLRRLQARSLVNLSKKIESAVQEIEAPQKEPASKISSGAAAPTDKRQGNRLDILTLVYYICLSDKGHALEQGVGRLLNISSGGLLIETSQPIDSPFVAVYGVDLEEDMIDLKAKVIRCQKQGLQKYTSGVSFIDASDKRHRVIAEFVRVFNRQRQNLPLTDNE